MYEHKNPHKGGLDDYVNLNRPRRDTNLIRRRLGHLLAADSAWGDRAEGY